MGPGDIIITDEAVAALEWGNRINAIKNPSFQVRSPSAPPVGGGYNIFLIIIFLIGAVAAYLSWPGKP